MIIGEIIGGRKLECDLPALVTIISSKDMIIRTDNSKTLGGDPLKILCSPFRPYGDDAPKIRGY
jgi:hypothetical protein